MSDLPPDAPPGLIIEEDDFLDHPDELTEDDLDTDEETQELRVLFPLGEEDASLASEWEQLFRIDESLKTIAPRTAAAYTAEQGLYSGSGRDTGIAARLRAYGLRVVEIAGWQTRGVVTFHPWGSVDHHTAAGRYGNAPSLNICINGRSDLPGPLCHVLIGRDNTCYVIAAGRANHAGSGSWKGVVGNSNMYGVEHENTGIGDEPWREDQRQTAAKVHAALLDWKRDSSFVCEHKEWTSRKIDKWGQSGSDMRSRVLYVWNTAKDSFTEEEEEVIAEMIRAKYNQARGKRDKDDNWIPYDVLLQEPNGYLTWLKACYYSKDPIGVINSDLVPRLEKETGRKIGPV